MHTTVFLTMQDIFSLNMQYMLVQSGVYLNMFNCDNIFWICYAHFNYAFDTPALDVWRGCEFFMFKIKLKEHNYF